MRATTAKHPRSPSASGSERPRKRQRCTAAEEKAEVEEEEALPLVCKQFSVVESQCLFAGEGGKSFFRCDQDNCYVTGLTNTLWMCFHRNYVPPVSKGRRRFTVTPEEGSRVDAQVPESMRTGVPARNKLARCVCAWIADQNARLVASQFCIHDPESNIGTMADLILQRNDTGAFMLVELKCGYAHHFALACGTMMGTRCKAKNSRKNQCFLQLAWMHHVLEHVMYPDITFEPWLVVTNRRLAKGAGKVWAKQLERAICGQDVHSDVIDFQRQAA